LWLRYFVYNFLNSLKQYPFLLPHTSGGTIKNTEIDNIGRNDIVVIQKGTETQELKYKKAEQLLAEGWTIKEVKK
jgi:hypothetical protein